VLRLYASGDQEQYAPFVYHDGIFRVTAQSFSYNRSIQFGTLSKNVTPPAQRSSEYLHLSMNLSVEPRMPLLNVGQVRRTAAEDEQKNSMLPPAANGMFGQRFYYYGGYRSFSQQVQVALTWPSKTARTLKVVRGTIPVTLLAEQRPLITVEDVLKSKGKKYEVDGTHLDVDEVGEAPKAFAWGNGNALQLKLSMRDTKPDTPEAYSWVQTLNQRLELQDAKGNKFMIRSSNWNETTATGVKGATFIFAGDGAGNGAETPAKLVLYNWVRRDHEVPFEFRDLP